MKTHILLATLAVAVSSHAFAQSSATSGTTQPLQSAPTAGAAQNDRPKAVIPPAARSGQKGLAVGEGAVTGEPVEIKRVK